MRSAVLWRLVTLMVRRMKALFGAKALITLLITGRIAGLTLSRFPRFSAMARRGAISGGRNCLPWRGRSLGLNPC